MKKIGWMLLALVLSLAVVALAGEPGRMTLKAGDEVYVCNCGPKCACDSMAAKEGKCTCGKEMVKGVVTRVEEGKAMVRIGGEERAFKTVGKYACDCGPACKCGSISQNPGKCVCGKEMAPVKEAAPARGGY